MKLGKLLNKKFLLLVMALILALGSTITAYAASCKNPTVKKSNKTVKCLTCGAKSEYVIISFHKGHTIKEVKVDGEKIEYDKYTEYNNGKCSSCSTKIRSNNLGLRKGTHKIEVKDNKGYWVTEYVTIKAKGCWHGDETFGDWWNDFRPFD